MLTIHQLKETSLSTGFENPTLKYPFDLLFTYKTWFDVEEVGRVYGKEALLKRIKSYQQNKLDRDLSRFLPKSQRKITSLLKAGLISSFG